MEQKTGRVAVVTGASRGIGRAIALDLARQGVSLVLGYQKREEAMEEAADACRRLGVEVRTVRGDIGVKGTAEALIDAALESHGRVDVLVNNAAVAVEELTAVLDDGDLERMVQTNVNGLVRAARFVLRPMLRQRGGLIVNLSSVLASRPSPGNAVYAGTKGFVESFTRSLAAEVGPKGIRVNAVAPGVIETDMSRAVRNLAENPMKKQIAMRRFGQPEEVAEVVRFLLSEEARYINGAVIPVDGGCC